MASRTIHDKIPHNVRVNKGVTVSTQKRKAADAVTPSVKGRQSVMPSTIGIAAKARLAHAAKRAIVAADAIGSLIAARDGDNPEAAALANKLMANKKFRTALSEALGEIHRATLEATYREQSKTDHGAMNELQYPEAMAAAREKERTGRDPHVAAGADSARPILGAEDMARVEQARAKLSRLRTAESFGDLGDIVRAKFGYEPRAVDADELYSMFEGKRK